MKHDFLDKYAHLTSPIHRLDPSIKIILALLYLILINFHNSYQSSAYFASILLILILLSKVPIPWFFKKVLIISPFLIVLSIFMILSNLILKNPLPLIRLSFIWIKTCFSILALTLLTSVTGLYTILGAMEKLHFPHSIVYIARFAYTYIFVIFDELHIVLRSLKSRAPYIKRDKIKLYGNLTASILLRSFSRSQKIYYSMLSRNFEDFKKNTVNFEFKAYDIIVLIIFLLILIPGIIL